MKDLKERLQEAELENMQKTNELLAIDIELQKVAVEREKAQLALLNEELRKSKRN